MDRCHSVDLGRLPGRLLLLPVLLCLSLLLPCYAAGAHDSVNSAHGSAAHKRIQQHEQPQQWQQRHNFAKARQQPQQKQSKTKRRWAQPARRYGEDRAYASQPWRNMDLWLYAVLNHTVTHTPRNATATKVHGNKYIVNLGAHYGAPGLDDVVSYVMQSDDIDGLAVDSDDGMPWAGKRIKKYTGFVTPLNVVDVMKKADVPTAPLLLKVDIDSYDVDVAMAVLESFSPVFIQVELNEKVPPPSCYCNRFPAARADGSRPEWKRLAGHLFGCSLMGYVNAFMTKNYRLVSVTLNDALFVRGDQADVIAAQMPNGVLPQPGEAFRSGYTNFPQRHLLFPWNDNVKAWVDETLPLKTRVNMMRAFIKANGDGEANGMIYPFVKRAKLGVWPCEELNE